MGKFVSVLIATLQFAFGIYVFKKPDLSGCGPLLCSLVVLFSLSLVLWDLPLYPRRLRKLMWFADYFAQYLIAVFWIEYLMGCFWFPLEAAILNLLPKTASFIEESLLNFDITCQSGCEILRREGLGMFMSYLLSFLILIAALHATRVINLSLLSSGCTPFLDDVKRRSEKVIKTYSKTLNRLRPKRSRPQNYCAPGDEDEDEFEFDPCDATPTTDSESYYAYR